MIVDTFDVSEQVALYRLDYLKEYPEMHANRYDDILVEMFRNYLDKTFPNKNPSAPYGYDDENNRDKWR